TIQVFAPDAGFGSVVFRGQPILSADGTFEAQVPTDNTHMKWPGKYTVRAEYGGAQRSAETTFMLTGNKDPVVPDMKPDPAITEHERMEEDPPRLGTEVVPVSTDKRSYDAGETITVRGKVDSTLGFGVTVQVFAPDAGFGSVVYRSQPILNTDGTFEARFDAGGSLMVWPGEYTIRVEYGGAQRYGETTFLFTGRPDPAAPVREPDPSITGTTITIEGATDLITYEITGGRVLAATASPSTTSLLLDIKAHENGIISLNMPRTIIDAVQNGYDIEFFILIDAEERPFTEIKSTSTHRTLNIPFSAVNTDIEIIGTFVVP
ncbi:MAG: hypothetical protein MPK62_06050, partial [Alphaproteobacteria bacterium]|nr:hypothetical protein [Alphaproteobacteria bacterium]